MFVRPPAVRSARNPGRRPMPRRVPLSEANRPLLRQFIRNRRSDPRYEAYVLEVREGPAVNGNTNAAADKSVPHPWVTVRDYVKGNQLIGLPVSVCDALLKHLLTCVSPEEPNQVDSSEESEIVCSSVSAMNSQSVSPAMASGDGKSPVGEAPQDDNSPYKKNVPIVRQKPFHLCRLKPIRIVCEATGCILEVTSKDPAIMHTSIHSEGQEQVVQADPSRRWIMSVPVETRPAGEHVENGVSMRSKRRHPWETRGVLELHESLMGQLSVFLADVVTRYRSVNQLPEVRSLYSASGGRRFFFDLRDTRWGKRLHISQVTDLHRNVIGIPLEALVSFRTRLDMIIGSLGLEDQHVLRSEVYGKLRGRVQHHFDNNTGISSQIRLNDATDSANGGNSGTKSVHTSDDHVSQLGGSRQRERERRRQRLRSYGGDSGIRQVGVQQPGSRSADAAEHQAETSTRRVVPGTMNGTVNTNQWSGGNSRNRRFPRRNRNMRPFNRVRKHPSSETTGNPTETSVKQLSVQSVPEPVIDVTRVAPVAEATA